MSSVRQFGVWIAAAFITVVLLIGVLRVQYQPTQERFALSVNARPAAGRGIFEAKGCAQCHGEAGAGAAGGPSLRNRNSLTSLPRLVTSMWNHVPRMTEAMSAAHVAYPTMTKEEMAQLVSYLFVAGLTDDSGDPARGEKVFSTKHCAVCHADGRGGKPPSSLAEADSPLAFTQTLWNHAAAMRTQMAKRGLQWPRLNAGELRDLFAYVQSKSGKHTHSPVQFADAAAGWELFQKRSCIDCHALRGRESSMPRLTPASLNTHAAPSLGGDASLPPMLSEFGEAMLNHFPQMDRAMAGGGKAPPSFQGHEIADLAIFLYSLGNVEPTGSPQVGASVFVWRGCAECHGSDAAGGAAPPLRGRGQTYTAVRLATGLWAHGNRMYEETRRRGQPWPHLEESDVGDLLAFLNTPPEKSGAGQ